MSPSAEEFGKLALEQLDTLARVAASLTGNRAEADDLVQETYLRALRAREQFELRGDMGIRPWLLRILHNTHRTRAARGRRQPVATDPDKLDASGGGGGGGAPFPAIPHDLDDTVGAAMDELPADLRSALILWAVEELSYKDMATVLDIPIGTVMSRMYRARQALAAKLRQRAPELLGDAAARYE
jgi:RNA polymerase sigma-70 factor (ECF subfamily)